MRHARHDAFFIDIESNFGVNPRYLTDHQIAEYAHDLSVALDPHPSDLVVIGCNPAIVRPVRDGWQGHARIVSRPGKNGADLALIHAATPRRLRSVHTVWICGADADLIPIFRTAGDLGRRRVLACGHQEASRHLRSLADRFTCLNLSLCSRKDNR